MLNCLRVLAQAPAPIPGTRDKPNISPPNSSRHLLTPPWMEELQPFVDYQRLLVSFHSSDFFKFCNWLSITALGQTYLTPPGSQRFTQILRSSPESECDSLALATDPGGGCNTRPTGATESCVPFPRLERTERKLRRLGTCQPGMAHPNVHIRGSGDMDDS